MDERGENLYSLLHRLDVAFGRERLSTTVDLVEGDTIYVKLMYARDVVLQDELVTDDMRLMDSIRRRLDKTEGPVTADMYAMCQVKVTPRLERNEFGHERPVGYDARMFYTYLYANDGTMPDPELRKEFEAAKLRVAGSGYDLLTKEFPVRLGRTLVRQALAASDETLRRLMAEMDALVSGHPVGDRDMLVDMEGGKTARGKMLALGEHVQKSVWLRDYLENYAVPVKRTKLKKENRTCRGEPCIISA